MKEQICRAFCDSVTVREVPAGLALSTTTASINGDPVGLYVVGPLEDGRYRLEDSGQLVPYLYAVGADLDNESRRQTFEELLSENDAYFDEEAMEIVSEPVVRSEVPGAALRFVSLLLRLSDLAFLAQEKVASTFKNDVTNRLKEKLTGKATLREGEPFSENLSDWEPDLVIEATNRDPVALFLVQTDNRAMEAMLLKSDAEKQDAHVSVVAMLERENSVGRKTRIRASNRLDTVPIFEGDENGAISRVVSEAIGRTTGVLH